MNAVRIGASLLATVVFLLHAAPAQAGDTVTLPFSAWGAVVAQAPGPGGTLLVTAEGHATHLGQYSSDVTLMIFPGQPPMFSGFATFVAANGDELHLINFGVMTDPLPNPGGDGGYQIIGGTGRFAGAGGQGEFSSHNGQTTFMGTITLPRGM